MRPPGRRWPARALRALLLGLIAVALTGCQLRTEVNLSVEDDGSGVVEVGVGLDEDGVSEHPDLLGALDFGDLVDAGWEVSEPAEERDGFTYVRVRHPFDRPADVAVLLEQVAGEEGPLREFRLTRHDAFAETRYRFGGRVDFAGGLDRLAQDPELADALGSEPVQLIEDRLGRAVDELLQFQVAVRLPGDVSSNAPTQASNGAVWRPSVLEQDAIELTATSTLTRTDRIVWTAVGGVAALVLVLFVAVRVVLWRRRSTSTG